MVIVAPEGPRFRAWVALFLFSCVCIAAHASMVVYTSRAAIAWVSAAISISLIFSFFGVVAHFVVPDKFVGQIPEGVLTVFLLIFWCAALPVIMNPNESIAVSGLGQGSIVNSNLYFFSWISFITILYILGDYSEEASGRNFRKELTPKNAKWFGLFSASIVVLGSAAKIHQDIDCGSRGFLSLCQRTNYAIASGFFGILISLLAIAMTALEKMTTLLETILSGFMFIIYVFGVGFITFGSGPATTLGNLYFSVWIGLGVAFLLFSDCSQEFVATRNVAGTSTATNAAPAPELAQVESQTTPPLSGVEVALEK